MPSGDIIMMRVKDGEGRNDGIGEEVKVKWKEEGEARKEVNH